MVTSCGTDGVVLLGYIIYMPYPHREGDDGRLGEATGKHEGQSGQDQGPEADDAGPDAQEDRIHPPRGSGHRACAP